MGQNAKTASAAAGKSVKDIMLITRHRCSNKEKSPSCRTVLVERYAAFQGSMGLQGGCCLAKN